MDLCSPIIITTLHYYYNGQHLLLSFIQWARLFYFFIKNHELNKDNSGVKCRVHFSIAKDGAIVVLDVLSTC